MTSSASLHIDIALPLDQFDLQVAFATTRRVTGIFGVSGSGKTTLLETIAGLRRNAHGSIRLGDDVWLDSARNIQCSPEQRGIGYVPQESLLFPHIDVRGNLRAGWKRAVANGTDAEERFNAVIRVLDIAPLLYRNPSTLSGGERQRVALGRALCSGPRILLLDEPLASLDAGMSRRILPFLHRVQSEFNLPMLLVSHNPMEVQALCEDLIVLREGSIVARGEPRDVLTRPEIFPIAEGEGFENMLAGRLLETRQETSTIALGETTNAPSLITPRSPLPIGSTLLLSIPANDILLAIEHPHGLSARNILPARVESLQQVGHLRLISTRLATGIAPIVVEVTAEAIGELGIEEGSDVYLIIKTSGITMYGGGPTAPQIEKAHP